MAVHVDLSILNNAATQGNWTANGYDDPQLNDSVATTPLYIEGTAAMFWPFKKGITDGYAYTSTISGTPSLTGRVCVGWLNMSYADLDNIPVTSMYIRISSSTGFTSNYGEWDAKAQILAPNNTAISGHTPVMVYPTNPDRTSGTPNYGTIESVGWVATSGNDNDGKFGGFDWFFIIGWIGAHSATYTDTWLSSMATDATPTAIPGTTSRPLGVFTRAGDFYRTNVSLRAGHGTSDTANTVISETGKTIFFDNLESEQELEFDIQNPSSTHTMSFTLTDCVAFWNDQPTTADIFLNAGNADTFKIDGCAFSRGGKITPPADSATRWIRSTKFDSCQAGTLSDGEFTSNIVSSGEAITVTGDADLTGTQILTPVVAADASGLIWNGNFDPDGNLDSMDFSKGTNAHHAIEFGTATPLTMTLRNIDFSGFTNTVDNNATPLYIRRTSGTVTVNLIGCTGITADGYKTSGATVSLVVDPVTALVNVKDNDGANLQNARVYLKAADGTGDLPFEESVTSITRVTTTATVTHTAHGLNSGEYVKLAGITDKTEDNQGAHEVTVTGANTYTYTTTNSGSTSYTGTITATGALIYGVTDVNGDISASRTLVLDQPVDGFVRKSSASPRFKTFALSGTVDNTTGLTINVTMILDE